MNELFSALQLKSSFELTNQAQLPSCFAVSDLAANSIAAVGNSISGLLSDLGLASTSPEIEVDQRLASLWFSQSIHPVGWELPPVWDAIAGDYQARDGWIKLHTNLSHHREAALSVLQCQLNREKVAAAVISWHADDLESEIVNAGGVAAMMRSRNEWQCSAQGTAVSSESLVEWGSERAVTVRQWPASAMRPLNGLRVLDLTRVLAGPVSTRTLAGFGAEILRIDPPGWDEPYVVPDITLGKRCANLALGERSDRNLFEQLLGSADVLIHGYRPGALDRLGYGQVQRQEIAPNLVEVSLDAYGWTGPWADRRGFDSLVQMSCGIAEAGMKWAKKNKPTPLPVQALDHATGYLMAAATVQAIRKAVSDGEICNARLSLARTAELLMGYPQNNQGDFNKEATPNDFNPELELTSWGQAKRLRPPLLIDGAPMAWSLAAGELGRNAAKWV